MQETFTASTTQSACSATRHWISNLILTRSVKSPHPTLVWLNLRTSSSFCRVWPFVACSQLRDESSFRRKRTWFSKRCPNVTGSTPISKQSRSPAQATSCSRSLQPAKCTKWRFARLIIPKRTSPWRTTSNFSVLKCKSKTAARYRLALPGSASAQSKTTHN